ncbi:unnamed protein product, partial [Allacma fusca]
MSYNYSEAPLLIAAGISSVFLIGYICVRLWEKINESSNEATLLDLDKDLEEGIANDGETYSDWNSFQQQHVITLQEHPQHAEWTALEWNEFLKKRNIYYSPKVNSIISVQSVEDVLADFSSMILDDQFEVHSRHGKLYKSLQPRTIYHMTCSDDSTDDFCVYKSSATHYLAIVEITNLGRGRDGE